MSFISSWRKFEFPLQFPAILRRLSRSISFLFSTIYLKGLLRFYGAEYGEGIRADGKVIIRCDRRKCLSIGEGTIINSCFSSNLVGATNPAIFECCGNGSITIGEHSGLSFTVLSSRCGISIGSHVKLGGNVRIFDHDYHSLDVAVRRGVHDEADSNSKPVKIEDDVFIGTNSIILKGVSIGRGAIIGAGSVVSKTIPAGEIWAGNPAQKIRDL